MSAQRATSEPNASARPLADLEQKLSLLWTLDLERIAYVVLFIIAVLTRFWDLGARVMSHDESLHTRYSWGLYRGDGFQHTPLMHGPVLFHMVALSYLLFGDSDFTARIYPALLGVLIVMFPIFLRRWLGKLGALSASFMLLISPMILYYSRYIREDIPAITGALIMVWAIWHYVEDRRFKYLLWLTFGQFYLFASKEVSFIYIAIFGSFLTIYFIYRLFETKWERRRLFIAFGGLLIVTLLTATALAIVVVLTGEAGSVLGGTQTAIPLDPETSLNLALAAPHLTPLRVALIIVLIAAVVGLTITVLIGQWKNLRRYPELDVMIVMGSLILVSLSPFLIQWLGFDPMDETPLGVMHSLWVTAPVFLVSVVIGLIWGVTPPNDHEETVAALPDENAPDGTKTITVGPGVWEWMQAFAVNRWFAIGALYWGLFIFFFTTMFTNGAGLGTGAIGSLAYWLAQQGVRRGDQPGYYYIYLMLPVYEFLPLILTLAAAGIGVVVLVRKWLSPPRRAQTAQEYAADERPEEQVEDDAVPNSTTTPERQWLDPGAPIRFPWQLFTGYWIVTNIAAYSVAGEKMPWLTTHLTLPMILLGGWVLGRALERIHWRKIVETNAWLLFILIPVIVVALLRVIGPACEFWPTNLLCNSVIPENYQGAFQGLQTSQLYPTYAWIAALVVLVAVIFFAARYVTRIGPGQMWRVAMLCVVGWLGFLTIRTAWRAAYVDYNQATEYLVYAHSSGAVKDVMAKIEELSLRTTDGLGIRVAYDNKVSWPFSWYFRNYYNAVYFGDQPSRGVLGDAPVIVAGPDNWAKVESLLGDRYYHFEYIRMWWPMQDYFDLKTNGPQDILNFLDDPKLQRGVWDIFYDRDYTAYGEAVGRKFELSQWPLADRMRLYIRKDTFAQVWSYGVAASQGVQATDPYAKNVRQLTPDATFGKGLLNRPHGLAIGPDRLLYVADSGNHRIMVFDQNGQFVRSIGKYGLAPQPDVLNEPWDVGMAPDGRVIVADTWNHRIVEYMPDGTFVTARGYQGPNILTDPLAFWGPRGIAVDAQGTVYLADTGNKRIQVFDNSGKFLRQIGTGGSSDGQLDEPSGVAVSKNDGLVYIADTWNQRVSVFSASGEFVKQWHVEAWFAQTNERPYIALDNQNNVYVTDPEAFRAIVFDRDGKFLYTFGDFSTISLAGGIVINDQGQLFLSDTAAGAVQRYNVKVTTP